MTTALQNSVFGHDLDHRHHLVAIQRDGNALTGVVEIRHAGAVRRWAEERGLEDATTRVSPVPAVSALQHVLKGHPSRHATAVTEVSLGQALELLRVEQGWAQVRTEQDRYIGWLPANLLGHAGYHPTHRFTGTRGHAYSAPRVRGEVLAELSWGARVHVVDTRDGWHETRLPDGRAAFVRAALLAPSDSATSVPVLESWADYLGTPYLWGGCSAWGIDCSGFVQLLHRIAGIAIPRDSDEQATTGTPVATPEPGDVATFPGHVGLFLGDGRMVHASSAKMQVTVDSLDDLPELEESLRGFVRFEASR